MMLDDLNKSWIHEKNELPEMCYTDENYDSLNTLWTD